MGNNSVYNNHKAVSNTPKYTTKRGDTFYINFRIPSGKFFRQSLATDSLKTAQATMSRLSAYIPLVQSGQMSEEDFKLKIVDLKALTKRDLDSLLFRLLETDLQEAERIPQLGSIIRAAGLRPVNPADTIETAAGYAGAVSDDLINGHPFSENLIKYMLKHEGFDPDSLPLDVMAAGSQLNMSRAQLYEAYQAFYSKDLPKYQQIVQGLKQGLPVVPEVGEPKLVAEDESGSLSLSDAWSMFVKEKGSHWVKSIDRENKRFFEILLYIVGDVPVSVITKQDIRKTLEVITALPKRFAHPYKTMTLQQCIDHDVPEEDLLSSAMVKKHLKIYSSFFKVFLKDEKDVLTLAPTEGIKYEVKENRGGNFSAPEMKRLVAHLDGLTDDNWRKAYFLTLCHTGARRGEIADLKVSQFRTDELTGRRYIFIEGGKTDHAKRQIPVHKSIEGILEKLAEGKKPTDRLFPKFPGYKEVTDAWVTIMRQCNAPDYNEKGQKRRVHSIRHSFITKALAHARPVQVQIVVGHSLTESLGITARYTHEPTLEELLPVVDGIDWK
ncbi:tyrosine-type recombinase/integrase [Enterobacter ludwigii]